MNLNQLRAKLIVTLPISNKQATILEPIAKQRFEILNNFLALQTRADIKEEEKNTLAQKILTNAILRYISDNLELEDKKFPIMKLDANELLVFAFGLIELLSNAWFINYEAECKHCHSKTNIRLVFEPSLLMDPNASIAQRIDYIKNLFEIEDNNFGEIKIILPEKKLEPRIITKKLDNNMSLELVLNYPIAELLFGAMNDVTKLTKAQLAYIHKLFITSEDKTKFYLTYDPFIASNTLSQIDELPEFYYKLIISEINKFDKEYNENYKISWNYNFVCPSCKAVNEMVELDMVSYFFNYHLSNTT